MAVTIAAAPISWCNDADPSGVPPPSYPAILDEMVAGGYGATEWSPVLPGFVPTLQRDLATRGLEVVGAYLPVRLHDPGWHAPAVDRALEAARMLRRLGARFLVLGEAGSPERSAVAGRVGADDALEPAAFDSLAAGLRRIGEALLGTGVRPVLHPHVGTYVETADEVRRLLGAVHPELLGVCLDTGHTVYGGSSARASLAELGDRVEYVHLKDVDGVVLERVRADRLDFDAALRQVVFCPLGEGVAEVAGVLEDLRDRAYDGVVVLEQDTSWDPPATARSARAFVRAAVGW